MSCTQLLCPLLGSILPLQENTEISLHEKGLWVGEKNDHTPTLFYSHSALATLVSYSLNRNSSILYKVLFNCMETMPTWFPSKPNSLLKVLFSFWDENCMEARTGWHKPSTSDQKVNAESSVVLQVFPLTLLHISSLIHSSLVMYWIVLSTKEFHSGNNGWFLHGSTYLRAAMEPAVISFPFGVNICPFMD